MIPLLDCTLGFIAIMLTLSLLVKTLTSLVKSYVDYYSGNLRAELDLFLKGMVDKTIDDLGGKHSWIKEINWKSLGEDFFSTSKMSVFLEQLGEPFNPSQLPARIDQHAANLRYSFEQKMKNLSLAAGLALCLFCNINALTIWKTLYSDQQVRTTFATEYSQKALRMAENAGTPSGGADKTGNPTGEGPAPQPNKEALQKQAKEFRENVDAFLADVNFGVGKIWREKDPDIGSWCYEMFGSLLTGLLVSVGAPYWHDLLRTISAFRKKESE